MFKIICQNNDCKAYNTYFYFQNVEEKVFCGICKNQTKISELSKSEFTKTFDYDPYEKFKD